MSIRYAWDDQCADCGEPAVCYWPCIDPDIRSFPYCRACVEKRKADLLIALHDAKGCGRGA